MNSEYKDKVIAYLEEIIKLDFTWAELPLESDVLLQVRKLCHPGIDFPIYRHGHDKDPLTTQNGIIDCFGNSADGDDIWLSDFLADSKAVAVATQIHHHTSTCNKKGTACRFHFDGAGKQLQSATMIDEEKGVINLKRSHPMVNNHCPAISAVTRSNHDVTAIFSSSLKRLQSMYYITSYVAKGEDDVSDIAAIREAFRSLESRGVIPSSDIQEQIRRIITRMNYLRQSNMQFSGAQVAAMFLNIGRDGMHYTNLQFSRLNLFQLIQFLRSIPNKEGQVSVPTAWFWDQSDCVDEDFNEDGSKPERSSESHWQQKGMTSEELALFQTAVVEDHSILLQYNLNHDSQDLFDSSTPPSILLLHDALANVDVSHESSSTVFDVVQHNIPLPIEDYIYRGKSLEDYCIYELQMWANANQMSPSEWEKYYESSKSLESGDVDGSNLSEHFRVVTLLILCLDFVRSSDSKNRASTTLHRKPWNARIPMLLGHSKSAGNSGKRVWAFRSHPQVPVVIGTIILYPTGILVKKIRI